MPTRMRLKEDGPNSGYPTTRDDDREMARDDRDETGRERDGGDHGYDPRRRGGALKPEKKREETIKCKTENEKKGYLKS